MSELWEVWTRRTHKTAARTVHGWGREAWGLTREEAERLADEHPGPARAMPQRYQKR